MMISVPEVTKKIKEKDCNVAQNCQLFLVLEALISGKAFSLVYLIPSESGESF